MGSEAQGQMVAQEIVFDDVLAVGRAPEEYIRIPRERRVDRVLVQHSRVRNQRREAQIFNGHFLDWQEYGGGRCQRTRIINLAFIAPQPVLRKRVAWRAWGLSALMLVASALAFWLSGPLAGAALGGFTVLSGMWAARRSHKRLVFRTRYGGIAVFELYAGWMRQMATDAFVAELQERCLEAEKILPRSRERLAAEMAEHRRLLKAGCLTEERYALAKKRLFSRFRAGKPAPGARQAA